MRRMSIAIRRPSLSALGLGALIGLALAARLPLFPQVAYMAPNPTPLSDSAVWEVWSRALWQHGLDDLSAIEPRTYVGYHYVFWAVGQVYALMSPGFELGTDRLLYLLKIPPVIFDLLLIPLIFAATRRVCGLLPDCETSARELRPVAWLEERGLAARDTLGLSAAAVFVLSPAVIYDSAVWAQSESVITFFMLGAVLLLAAGRPGAAWALWSVAFIVKPQPVVIVPALAAFTLWRFGWTGVARGAAGALAGAAGALGYIVMTGNGPYVLDVYRELFQTYDTQISVNAWNVWWPWQQESGLRASDVLFSVGPVSASVEAVSFALLVATTVITLAYLHTRRDLVGLLAACAMLVFAFYLFPMSTHERYLYPLFAFAAPLAVLAPRWLLLYLPLAASFFLNVYFASPTDPDMSKAWLNSDLGYAMAGLNLAIFAVACGAMLSQVFQLRLRRLSYEPTAPAGA